MTATARTLILLGRACLAVPNVAGAETIYACKANAQGTIRMVTATATCSSKETKISWNTEGPMGPAGASGAAGPAGPAGDPGPPGRLAPPVLKAACRQSARIRQSDGSTAAMEP